jgi:hypothetical protein
MMWLFIWRSSFIVSDIDKGNSHVEVVQVVKPQLGILLGLVQLAVAKRFRQFGKVLFGVSGAVLLL